MNNLSLKERITVYLYRRGDWVNSGHLEKLAIQAGYKGDNCGRRLRELENDGIIEVKYVKSLRGPKVAVYRYKLDKLPQEVKVKTGELSEEDMVRYAVGAR